MPLYTEGNPHKRPWLPQPEPLTPFDKITAKYVEPGGNCATCYHSHPVNLSDHWTCDTLNVTVWRFARCILWEKDFIGKM